MTRTRLALAAFILALALPATAVENGVEVEGVAFPGSLTADGAPLVLQGAALLRYRVVIKAYVSALYLGPEAAPERVLEDVPKRLEIEYFWKIGADDFARATDEGISRNVSPAELEALRPRIERMNALYRDIQPGDRYALTYLPGRGTELAKNGETLGVVEGADFASALFGIWLGDDPLDRKLKSRLLGSG